MIHPDTELRFKNDDVGYGVFATRPIPAGTIVWTLCELDRRISPADRAAYPPAYLDIIDRYSYIDSTGDFILCWDHGRYVNHSCGPTTVGIAPGIDVAVRDLAPGDEITCDYGTLNLLEPLHCLCGDPACRRVVGKFDLPVIADRLDQASATLLPLVRQVEQPLLPFVTNAAALSGWLSGASRPPSSHAYALRSA